MAQRDESTDEDRLVRTDHDPQRPSLSSRQAANRIGVTPQAVIDGVKRGTIDGYFLRGPQRKRWFAYVSSVEAVRNRRLPAAGDGDLQQRLARMENALMEQRTVAELKDESYALFRNAAKQMAEANNTLMDAYEKLRHAQEAAASFTRSDWVPAYPPGGG